MAAGSTRSLPIRIEGVTKRYGGNAALDAVELDIKAAEFLTMLGPSGSGKTTLLMVLAGFVRPESGRVNFGKTDVTLLPPHRRNVGMVFQSYALFPHMNVAENVMYPLRLRGIGRDQARTRAEEVLGMMHLAGFGERRIDQLSGGQQQRVALARAIVFEPPILLMDEPLSALDKKLRESMQAEIRRIHERVGATTVYVTHDQREALVLSDRVAVINGGQLLQVDTPERIYHAPANLFVADFIGDSHFLPVERSDRQVLLDGRPLRLPSPPPGTSETLTLVVRPEKLELLAARESQTHNVLTGRVEERIFLGDAVMLTVRLDGGTAITVKIQARHGLLNEVPDSGTAISLGLHPEDTILLPRGATSGAALPAEPSGDG